MSRSYKHTPAYTEKSTYHKRRGNKRIRRNPYDSISGKSNLYKREYPQYDVCDYRFWGENIGREESMRNLRDEPGRCQKIYRR